ncbi:hypothetical protein CLOSTHATH_02305 [Hungatella hathewayi DSM 13479]|uniref:Uncharacterized protein n=1 Tax=Hungatella hathewayi DSM 13479 TaxID=566550 RepID=D3AFC1_9FIRM|nr:hypothetical protein CLOSTHATH_02305 [Hungatella hathewayi DSM 13479]
MSQSYSPGILLFVLLTFTEKYPYYLSVTIPILTDHLKVFKIHYCK